MSPPAYRMVRVKLPLPRPRARILDAARQLLANESETDLGMEAIARRAEGSRLYSLLSIHGCGRGQHA